MKPLFVSVLARLPKAAGFSLLVASAHLQAMPANLVGSYQADLVVDSVVKGRLDVTLNAKGRASGKAIMPNGKSYGFGFQLSQVGEGVTASNQTVYNKSGQTLTLTSFSVNAERELAAEFDTTIVGLPAELMTANGVGLVTFTGKAGNVAPNVGPFTMAMTAAEGASEGTPAGAGYATLTVTPNGKLSYKGKLGDGSKLTGSALLDINGEYGFFNAAYPAGGVFVARLDLGAPGVQSEDGYWHKPENQADKKYKNGFTTGLDVQVAQWTKLTDDKIPDGFTNSKNFAVDFSGEGLGMTDFNTTLPDTARFTKTGAVQAVAGGGSAPAENNSKEWNKLWNVKVNPATGEFSGTQVLKTTVGSKTTSKKIKVSGVLLLDGAVGDEAFGLGQYLVTPTGGSEVSGLVSFSGPLEDNKFLAAAGTYEFLLSRTLVGVFGAPDNVPAHNSWAQFTLSEDMQKVTFAGRTFPLSAVDAVYYTYSNKSGNFTISRDYTGAFTMVQGTVKAGLKIVIFNTANPAPSNIHKL